MTRYKLRRFFAFLISLSLLMGSIAIPAAAYTEQEPDNDIVYDAETATIGDENAEEIDYEEEIYYEEDIDYLEEAPVEAEIELALSQLVSTQRLTFNVTPATAQIILQDAATGAAIEPETAGGTAFAVASGTYAFTIRASGHSTEMGLVTVAEEDVVRSVALTVPQTTRRFAGLGDENHNRPNTGGPGGTHRDMEHEGPSTGWPGNWVGWIRPVAWIKYSNVDLLGGIEEYSVRFARQSGSGNLFEVRIAPVGAGFEAAVPIGEILNLGAGTGGWGNPGRVVTQTAIHPHAGGMVDVYAVFLAQEYNYGGLELVLRARDELVIPEWEVTISPRPYEASVTLMTLSGEVIAPTEPGSNVFNVEEGFYRYVVEHDGFITKEEIVMANASRRAIVVLLPDTGNDPIRHEAEGAFPVGGTIIEDQIYSNGRAVGNFATTAANPNATFSNISHVRFEGVNRPTTGIVQVTVGYRSSVTFDGQHSIGLRTADGPLIRVPLNPDGRTTVYLDMWSGENIIRVSNIIGATAGTWVNLDYIEVHPDTTPGSVDPNEGDTRFIPPVNPIIRTIFTADPEAKVWPTAPDRLFIYPSRDRHPSAGCDFMDMYHVFSTPNMVDFRDEGEILRYNDLVALRNDPSTPHWDSMTPATGTGNAGNRTFMWAPDAVYRDGWYYFYWPVPLDVNGNNWGRTWASGVVRSRYPDRNFEQVPVEEAHPGFRGYIHGLIGTNIDIAVHVFPDPETGRDRAYFYVGGGQHFWQGTLKDNMVEIDTIEIVTCSNAASCNVKACQSAAGWVDAPDVAWYTPGHPDLPPLGWYSQGHAAIHQRLPSFHEGPSLFRRAPEVVDAWNENYVGEDGYIYYLIYPAGNEPGAGANRPKFDYSIGATPLGPWAPQGQFFGNVGGDTNHGSILEFNGEWYMFYHTPELSSGVGTERSTAVDRVVFNPNGSIVPFRMTHDGVSINGPEFTRPQGTEYRVSDATLTGGARATSMAGAPSSDESIAIGLNAASGDGIRFTGVDGGAAHPETGRGNRAMIVFHYSTADVLPKMELLVNGLTHSYINFSRTGGRTFFAEMEFTAELLPGADNIIELRRGASNNQGTIHLSHIEVIVFDDSAPPPGWFDVTIEVQGSGTVSAELARATDDTVQGVQFSKAAGSQILLEPIDGDFEFVGWEVLEPAGWEVVVMEVTDEVDGVEVTTAYHSVRMPYGNLRIRAIFGEETQIPADRTELQEAIALAEGRTQANYTPQSWNAMQAALAAANAADTEAATQEQVDAANTALRSAINALEPVETAPEVDKAALSALTTEAAARQAASYTTASFAPFNTARAAAQAVLANEAATQAQVDAAYTALRNATNALVAAPTPGPDPGPGPGPGPGGSIGGGGGGGTATPTPTPPTTGIDDDEVPLAALESVAAFIQGYPDDTFRGTNRISREEFVTILFRMQNPDRLPEASPGRQSFTDVAPDRWSFDAIEWAVTAGILEGGAAATFQPRNELTRAEMAVMLVRAEGWTEVAENIFSDIEDHANAEDILKAVYAGIFEGFPDGTFRPDATATRYEMVTALVRYAVGGPVTDDMITGVEFTITDVPRTHWAYRYVVLATAGFVAPLPE